MLHRKEHYAGKYSPEVLAVVDEVTLDENPSWWPEQIAQHKAEVGDDASAWAVLTATLDADAVMAVLYPDNVVDLKLKTP